MSNQESMPVFLQRSKKEKELSEMLPFVREAYEKAEKMMSEEAIDPRDFINPYASATVEHDITWAKKKTEEHEKEFNANKAHADIMEAIMYEHIEQSDWFGENARTIKTSKFDDIVNGVDLIVEFEEGEEALQHMGLAVDVTFGEVSSQNKILDIKESIRKGKLAEIKYFKSERSPHKGIYYNLPRVVVGADRNHVFDLMKMWIDKTRKKEFATHPIQVMILHDISSQLMHFEQYAMKCEQNEIAIIYRRQRATIQKILKQKVGIEMVEGYEREDGVHNGIKKQLELF